MTDKEIIIDGKHIKCPCYIDRPLHRYDKGCLIQNQAFAEQQTKEKPILRCDEIKNCRIKENYKQLACKEQECEKLKEEVSYGDNQNIRWCRAWLKMWRQRNLYKQALEKIENFMIYELSGQNEWVKKSVLNIINEVKNA